MKGRGLTLPCVALLPLLLAACTQVPDPPVPRINLSPIQRHEITVELIDPPPDIRQTSGKAYFAVPDVSCMPTPDRIAGYTPGSSYIREFALTQVSRNFYKGHIFLDWPVDEDYYGLGVCKWEFAYADTTLTRNNGFLQDARLYSEKLVTQSLVTTYRRTEMRDKYDKVCFTPSDPIRANELERISYLVIIKASPVK